MEPFSYQHNPHGGGHTPQPEAPASHATVFTAESAVDHSPILTLPVADTPTSAWPTGQADAIRPVPVVKVLSPLGVEYVFMVVALFTAAIALTAVLLTLVNGQTSFAVLAFPTAALVVSLPVFAGLFLRLKKLELQQASLKLDPSKRRSTQFTQIFSFVVTLFTVVGFVFAVFAKLGGQSSLPIGKAALNCLCLLVVFGGMLAYYWHDEHKVK